MAAGYETLDFTLTGEGFVDTGPPVMCRYGVVSGSCKLLSGPVLIFRSVTDYIDQNHGPVSVINSPSLVVGSTFIRETFFSNISHMIIPYYTPDFWTCFVVWFRVLTNLLPFRDIIHCSSSKSLLWVMIASQNVGMTHPPDVGSMGKGDLPLLWELICWYSFDDVIPFGVSLGPAAVLPTPQMVGVPMVNMWISWRILVSVVVGLLD